jgi:hypothetical protein
MNGGSIMDKKEEEKWLKDVSLTAEEFKKPGYGSADKIMKEIDERIDRIRKEKGIPEK